MGRRPSTVPLLACRWAGEESRKADMAMWLHLLRWSLIFTVPVFLTAMVLPALPFVRPLLEAQIFGFPLQEVVKWAFTTPVQFWIGARFHVGAWRALRSGRYCAVAAACPTLC